MPKILIENTFFIFAKMNFAININSCDEVSVGYLSLLSKIDNFIFKIFL